MESTWAVRHGESHSRENSICGLAYLMVLSLSLGLGEAKGADRLEKGFAEPPQETKPWCYWYWISDHMSKEGITRDLEAMARVGIGEALIGNIFLDDIPAGKVKVLSTEWWGLIDHAMREGGRTGVNIGMFNCPGWSQSGGPWIKPEHSMRHLIASEARVSGPSRFAQRLPAPKEPFQELAVLAFPAPQADADSFRAKAPRLVAEPAISEAQKLVDGATETAAEFPGNSGRGNEPLTLTFELPEPFTARSLQITPAEEAFAANCELQAANADGSYRTIRTFKVDRSNMSPGVGFMPRGPVAVSFAETTSSKFRLLFTGISAGGKARLAEIDLSGAARLEAYVEKQLGKMHPTPLPMWDSYLWKTQAEPESRGLTIAAETVQDITQELAGGGWDVPAGEWIIQRIGLTPTGMKNSPASPEGQGLEVDKMNRAMAKHHFGAFIGEVLRRVPAENRKAFTRVIADSYEMGSQNWTDGLGEQFRERYGYDPKPWLPALSGRLVGGADQSERFLWDLRRLVADRVAIDYVGGLREACSEQGLGLWLENYGHWGFPSEFLKYGSRSDRIGGEYWVTGDLGSIECRAASSCANTYGKSFVSAESFTGGPAFQNAPSALKARGDWAFCEGVNHLVLHVYIQQPWEDKVPGVNAWFGTEFNRHNTWFEQSKGWVEYLRRCCWLLQQGTRVADVAYFIGEDAPKMTGVRDPELPPGRDFDYINAEVIQNLLGVKDGILTLPHGTTYRVLVLPNLETMRPRLLRRVSELVAGGATVVGRPPTRSPSLQNYPACDDSVRQLASKLWGGADTTEPGERRVGKGRLVWGRSLEEVFASLQCGPDFESSTKLRFTHRRSGGTEIYFVANPKAEAVVTTAAFRAGNKRPELWFADSGHIERPAVYDCAEGVVRLPLALGPHGSVFVVFREKAAPPSERIVSVARDGKELFGTKLTRQPASGSSKAPNNFTFAVWVNPADDTTLVAETNRGVVGMSEQRNDALAAPHGESFGGSGHAGCGLSVGRNGICVFEHGANYFAPPLVYRGPITNWTHVTVVYRDGQPRLYLAGRLARTGLKSEHVVHSGAAAGGAPGFRGQLGSFEQFGRALTDGEVAELTGTMRRPHLGPGGPPVWLAWKRWGIGAVAREAGDYELTLANGKRRKVKISEPPAAQLLEGAWQVRFTPGWGAPEQVVFDRLIDWARHPDQGIAHYSGKATYRKTFSVSRFARKEPVRFILDLGSVKDLVSVRVNGQDLGTLWLAPWSLEITSALRGGMNVLELEVINTWNNRLAGDQALPEGQRRTFLLAPTVNKNTPLLPSGLLGPVVLRQERLVDL